MLRRIISRANEHCLYLPSATPSSLPSYRMAHGQRTLFFFPLNKPYVSSQKILCVISGGRREAQGKNVERLSVHNDIDVCLREKREELKVVG